MATREDIKTIFHSELTTAVSGLVPSSDVRLQFAGTEAIPHVAYNDSTQTLPHNRSGVGIHRTESGKEFYAEHVESQFTVIISASDESELEQIYSAIQQHFHRFKVTPADPRSLNGDLWDIEVESSQSDDIENDEETTRVDVLDVFFRYTREYEITGTPIDQVNGDADGFTYNSN